MTTKKQASPSPERVLLKVPEIDATIKQWFESGEIAKNHDLKKLHEKLLNVVGSALKKTKCKLGFEVFKKRLFELVFTRERENHLRQALSDGLSAAEWHEYNTQCPLAWVEERARWLTGASRKQSSATSFYRGLANFGDDLKNLPRKKFPKNGPQNPHPISSDGRGSCILVLNGALVGTVYNRLIKDNVARRALAEAEARNAACVILTNFIDIEITKAGGPLRVLRALARQYNTNVDVLSESYQKKAQKIISGFSTKDEERLIYETSEEVLRNLMAGWSSKITIRPDGTPEFSGPVKVVLGYKEEALAAAIAYWRCNYLMRRHQIWLSAKKRAAQHALKEAIKNNDAEGIKELTGEVNELTDELSRVIVSNIRDNMYRPYYEKALTYLCTLIEKAIPNSEVIGCGSTTIQYAGKRVKIHVPGNERVKETLLIDYTKTFGVEVMRKDGADGVVICHPYAPYPNMTQRENDRGTAHADTKVFVAPICVDEKVAYEKLANVIRGAHNFERAVFSEKFRPGILCLEFTNKVVQGEFLPISTLGRQAQFEEAKISGSDEKFLRTVRGSHWYGKYIWIQVGSDPHYGGQSKAWIVPPDSDYKQLGMAEAAIYLMRRDGYLTPEKVPVHGLYIMDDPTQGHHFENHNQVDPRKMPYAELEHVANEIVRNGSRARTKAAIRDEMKRLRELLMYDRRVSGTYYVQHQMQEFIHGCVIANVDFFDVVLQRCVNAGIEFRGASKYLGAPYDSRDVGAVFFGSGNHFGKTIQNALTEGWIYALVLRERLAALPFWQGKRAALEQLVTAPTYGNRAIGWGTVQASHGYTWGLDIRDSPPRMGSWMDPLRGWVANDPSRGDYAQFLKGFAIIKMCGDKHFLAHTATPYAHYFMSPAGTPTDQYGEHGFPPNSTGVMFVGIPVNGPDEPVILRSLSYANLKEFVEKKISFDWAEFLPNPV